MDCSYIAGFFDGEGNVNKIVVKGYTYYQIRMYQAGALGEKLLHEIKNFLGYGSVRPKKSYHKNYEIVYELAITSKKEILDFKNRVGFFCKIKTFPSDDLLVDMRLSVLG